ISHAVTVDLTAPTVSLSAADFTNQLVVNVNVKIDPVDSRPLNTLFIDVDLNGDGKFTGSELRFYTGQAGKGELPIILAKLTEGQFRMRARVFDVAGNVGKSSVVTVRIDPNAGFIGSQTLLNLYADYLNPSFNM